MPVLQLNAENLKVLDEGKVAATLDTMLKRAVQDCMDRPAETKARLVTMQIEITPDMEPGGDCTKANAQIQFASKLPAYRTRVLSMGIRRNATLVFNEDEYDDFDQRSLLEDQNPNGRN